MSIKYTALSALTVAPDGIPILIREGQEIPEAWVDKIDPCYVSANGKPLASSHKKGRRGSGPEVVTSRAALAVDQLMENPSIPVQKTGKKNEQGAKSLAREVLGAEDTTAYPEKS